MHSDSKKRRSFLALIFTAGDVIMQTTFNNQFTSRIDNNTLTHTYQYDANGNQTQSTGSNARIIEYTAFFIFNA
jgi:hypothetical protein